VRRLEAAGGQVRCGARAERIVLRGGRARAVRTADGEEHPAARAVLADVGAPQLYRDLVGYEHLPARVRTGIERFEYDPSTVKVDWALSGPVPWEASELAAAGTIHVADSLDHLTDAMADIAAHRVPDVPFLVGGQYARYDPSRQPDGTESVQFYTHVPQRIRPGEAVTGTWDDRDRETMAERMEAAIERHAPGFRQRIVARTIQAPPDLEAHDANLVNGALNGGTAQLHQQLVLRPVPGLGRAGTPVPGLFLASASAHPGGGVHGACGANAARAALRGRWAGALRRPVAARR
jgi:phytoene dehydrogenase-like protein